MTQGPVEVDWSRYSREVRGSFGGNFSSFNCLYLLGATVQAHLAFKFLCIISHALLTFLMLLAPVNVRD